MPSKKRARTEAEIAALAARLGEDWTPGDAVMPWLRKHVDELTDLVHDEGWSWSAIGQALDAAGIRYSTGRPWSAPILTVKAKLARDANARRAAEKARRTAASQFAPVAEMLKAALTELASQPPRPAARRLRKGQPHQPPQLTKAAAGGTPETQPARPSPLSHGDEDDGIVITPAGGPKVWKPGERDD